MKHVLFGTVLLCALAQAQSKVTGPVVLFFGPPGSGKTTQATAAAKTLNVPVVSTESLLKGSSGQKEALNRLFTERLERGDYANGMVLDGYPSTKEHIDYLSRFVREGTIPRPLAIVLQLQDIDAIKRAGNADDIQERLREYHRTVDEVRLNFMNLETILIDGAQPAATVERQVQGVLKSRYKI